MSGSYLLKEYEWSAFEGYEFNLEDVIGREYEKSQFLASIPEPDLDELLVIGNFSCYLLTAPVGYGKSYLASCLAQSLKKNRYNVYCIDCEEIMEEDAPAFTWKNIFKEIIEHSNPQGEYEEGICLYLENLKAIGQNKKCVKLITSCLQEMYCMDCKCMVIATAVDVSDIPMTILKKFSILELGLPEEKDRMEYFKRNLIFSTDEPEELLFAPVTGLSDPINKESMEAVELTTNNVGSLIIYCAQKTEGLSFGELNQVQMLLNKRFKYILDEKTMGGDPDMLCALIKEGKHYFVTEREFLEIIEKVKHVWALMRQEETPMVSGGNGVPYVASVEQPPVNVYVTVPGVQGDSTEYNVVNQNVASVSGGSVKVESDQERTLKEALGENPAVETLFKAWREGPKDVDINSYNMQQKTAQKPKKKG